MRRWWSWMMIHSVRYSRQTHAQYPVWETKHSFQSLSLFFSMSSVGWMERGIQHQLTVSLCFFFGTNHDDGTLEGSNWDVSSSLNGWSLNKICVASWCGWQSRQVIKIYHKNSQEISVQQGINRARRGRWSRWQMEETVRHSCVVLRDRQESVTL